MQKQRSKITVRIIYNDRTISEDELSKLIINSSVVDRIVNSVADRLTDVANDIPQSAS